MFRGLHGTDLRCSLFRADRPRVNALQQFPTIPVSVHLSRPLDTYLLTSTFSVASRGAKFQDATYHTIYRNVSIPEC